MLHHTVPSTLMASPDASALWADDHHAAVDLLGDGQRDGADGIASAHEVVLAGPVNKAVGTEVADGTFPKAVGRHHRRPGAVDSCHIPLGPDRTRGGLALVVPLVVGLRLSVRGRVQAP